MVQEVQETIADLDDRTKDVDVTDIKNDVAEAEVIASANAASSAVSTTNASAQQQALNQQDMQDREQARRHREEMHLLNMNHQSNLNAGIIRAQLNADNHTNELNQQTIRHTDHTLLDAHPVGQGGSS